MNCQICRSELKATKADLPLKVRERALVLLQGLPVLECESCYHDLLEDSVLERVDEILAGVSGEEDLEIVLYAA